MAKLHGTVTDGTAGDAVADASVTATSGTEIVGPVVTDAEGSYGMLIWVGKAYVVKAVKGSMESATPTVSAGAGDCEVATDLVLAGKCPICQPTVTVGHMKQGGGAPWAKKKLDCSSPIYMIIDCPAPSFQEKGCLMTCLANVTPGKTPDEVNRILGGIVQSDGGLSCLSDAAARLGYVGAKEVPFSEDEIMAKGLCRGDPVLACVTSPGSGEHWVAITGQVDDPATALPCDDYTISDPGYSLTVLSAYTSGSHVTGIFRLVRKKEKEQ